MSIRGRFVAAVILAFLATPARAADVCLDCHEPDLHDSSRTSFAMLPTSAHAGLACSDCHTAVNLEDHPSESARIVECSNCHGDVAEEYAQSVHHRKLEGGDSNAPFCYDCHGIHNIRARADSTSPSSRTHIPLMCAKCHSTTEKVGLIGGGQESPYAAYSQSIHGKLILEEGMEGAAVCSDCHEPHSQRRKHDPKASIFKSNIPATCGKCHGEITEQYNASVHGKAVQDENFDAPVCTDCHSEHRILPPDDEKSKVYGANISRTTCLDCHKTLQLADAQGIYKSGDYTYRDSYHGAASRAGVVEVANCASCHGVHNILPSSDPKSSIHKDNLPNTCGKCHPDASVNFAAGTVHRWEETASEPAAAWVRFLYIWLIGLVLGGMTIHNGILFVFHLRHRDRSTPTTVEYLRFTRNERWQHWIMAFLFIGLVITGFAFRFSDSWWSKWWVGSSSGFLLRDFLHRLFGALFGGLMLYHMGSMWFTKRGHQLLKHLWPTIHDVRGVVQNLRFHLGFSRDRMQVPGLFDYAEKAEYWALVWGSWVMLLTGLPMWFENWALSFMPLWLLDVSRTVHFYEAILASGAIVIWHFYFVMFDPEYYPLNTSMITGRAHPREGFEPAKLADETAPKADDADTPG